VFLDLSYKKPELLLTKSMTARCLSNGDIGVIGFGIFPCFTFGVTESLQLPNIYSFFHEHFSEAWMERHIFASMQQINKIRNIYLQVNVLTSEVNGLILKIL